MSAFRNNNTSKFLLSAGLLGFIAPAALGQITLDPAVTLPAGSQPSGTAIADFDNDGDADLVTTVDNPDRIVVMINDGTGAYSLGPATFLPNSSSPQDIVAADFDGDGMTDVAVAMRDPFGSVAIMRNTGGASFVTMQTVAVGDRPRGLDAADFDGDGDFDLGCANRDDDTASIITNNGGSFSAVTLAAGAEPRAITFGDFDNDGDLDAAVSNHDSRSISIYTNNGGSFALSTTLSTGGQVRPEGIDAADLNGDGLVDLGVATNGVGFELVSVFMSTGGGFTGPIGYATGGLNTGDIVLVDLNCDGIMDAATANKDSANISVLQGTGTGGFGPATTYAAGISADDIATGDIDGDGDADLATANSDGNTVSVFRNQSCEVVDPCPADVNDDNTVNTDDLLMMLANWGSCDCSSDVNGDGLVDVSDLLELLAAWGDC